jgi:hypothetical protein
MDTCKKILPSRTYLPCLDEFFTEYMQQFRVKMVIYK